MFVIRFLFALAIVAACANAADSGKCGTAIWNITSDGHTLVFSGDNATIGCMICRENRISSSVDNLVVQSGVVSIDDGAFEECGYVLEVNISETVTSLGTGVFRGMNSVKNFYVDSGNPILLSHEGALYNKDATKLIQYPKGNPNPLLLLGTTNTIGSFAFANFTFETFGLPDIITTIEYGAFASCRKLKYFELSETNNYFKFENGLLLTKDGKVLVTICEMNGNRDVVIPDTVNTILGFASYMNAQINSLDLGKGVQSIGSFAFYSCGYISGELVIPDSVTSIGSSAFSQCTQVTSVKIGNGLTTIENYTFSGMKKLTSVQFGEGIESVGTRAFSGCPQLVLTEYENAYYIGPSSNPYRILYRGKNTSVSTLKIHGDTERITEESFMDNSTLKSVVIPNKVKVIEKSAFKRTGLESLTLGSGVKTIDDYAFAYSYNIKELIIPDSVTFIGDYAFYGDYSRSAATNIKIGNKVSHIGDSAFSLHKLVEELEIPDSVTYIGTYAFYCLDSVKSIKVGKGAEYIGFEAFFGNPALKTLQVDSGNPYYKTIDNVLYDKDGKTLIFCVPTKTSVKIEDTVTTIEREAFYACVDMPTITIPKSVTSVGRNAFGYCTSLQSIYVANGNPAFKAKNGCLLSKNGTELLVVPKGRKYVSIPTSVTHIPTSLFSESKATSVFAGDEVAIIDTKAFDGAQQMEEISIGSGVVTMGSYPFSRCYALKKFCYFGKKDLGIKNIFDGSTRDLNVTVPLDYEGAMFCNKRIVKASECTVSAEGSDSDESYGSDASDSSNNPHKSEASKADVSGTELKATPSNIVMAITAFIASAMLYLFF